MKALVLAPLLFLVACSTTESKKISQASLPTTLSEALESNYRSEKNKTRDVYRHPSETLEFFDLKPEMTVIEIAPGAGWYAEILAPYLSSQGKYIAAAVPVSVYAGGQKFLDWVDAHPELKSKITVNDFRPPAAIAEPGTADMVLTFRNVHNWTTQGADKGAFKSFFEALKPGGILGVVEHRENPKKKFNAKSKSGYVSEAYVIRLAEAAGFKLVAKSEINANPKDTKNYPKGVWTLPPSYAEGEKDRSKYADIGESDRMTLKFVKP